MTSEQHMAGSPALGQDEDLDRPYKGAKSYGPQDAELFFGREQEARQCCDLILASRVSLLYAASGAGKTSLLNARVLPDLERHGWIPIRVRLGENPLLATRDATLLQAFPLPGLERACISDLCRLLGKDGISLREAVEQFADLPASIQDKRSLLAPRSAHHKAVDGTTLDGPVSPFVGRLVRGTLSLEDFARGLQVLAAFAGAEISTQLSEKMSLLELETLLSAPALETGHRALIEGLLIPRPGFAEFFDHLWATVLKAVPTYPMAIVFDQFEEIFTRFADAGPAARDLHPDQPDWRLRWRFFEELEGLLSIRLLDEAAERDGAPGGAAPPLRIVISMREDYVAQLAPLRRLVPDLNEQAYRIDLLRRDQAIEAIRQPARIFGYDYSPACCDKLLAELTKEGRFIEPAHIQIVCEKIWLEFGSELSSAGQSAGPASAVSVEQFDTLKGAGGILRNYFCERLAALEPLVQLEALDILQPLITGSRTRNIVEQRALLAAPFRFLKLRERALAALLDARVLRVERRLNGDFVEITHEFLIQPILDETQARRTREETELRRAIQSLTWHTGTDFRANASTLPSLDDFELIHQNRDRISWSPEATRLMMCAALVRGAPRAALLEWIKAQVTEHSSSLDEVLERQFKEDHGRRPMPRTDWLVLEAADGFLPPGVFAHPVMLRSVLRWGRVEHRTLLERCVRGVSGHVH